MTQRLAKRLVDSLTPSTKDVFIWDSDPRGFGLKVTPAGKKVFIYQYRTGGRGTPTKRVTIGPYGTLTPDQARSQAQRAAGDVAAGRDPGLEKQRQRAYLAAQSKNTFGGLIDSFIKDYAGQHQRNYKETERLLRHDAERPWSKRPAASITRQEVASLLQSVANRAPVTANRLGAALRKLFNWAAATGRLEKSPMTGLPLPSPEHSRDRVLTDDELSHVIKVAKETPYPFGPFFELLILTAQRRDEVAGMRWSEITGDQWTIPAARSKNGKAHIVHLSCPALAVLSGLPRPDGIDLVFTTTGQTPISGFSKAKADLDRLSGVTGWRLHDIRRTITTGLANLGHLPHVCDKLLNHTAGTISGTAAVYQKAEFLDERRKACAEWGDHIARLQMSAVEYR